MRVFKSKADRAVPAISILTEVQRQVIYNAALKVIHQTGIRIHHEGVLSMLKMVGCSADNDVVRIPESLVESSLKTAPKTIKLYTREGEEALRLGEDIAYFGAGVGAPFILDSFTGEKRLYTKRDVEQAALLQDALPNIDFVMGVGEISDVSDPSLADIHQFQAMLLNTSKPINFMATSARSTNDIIEMASIAAGGEDRLRERPFIFLFGAGPTPPLSFEKYKMERLMLCAEKGLPVVSLAASGSGGTAPITPAGHLVAMLAELLAVVVISQVCREGAPIIIGGMPLTMDMRSTIFSYGAPEFYLTNVAITEIIRGLELPVYSTGGVSDSKLMDEQAAIEATASSYLQLLSRANLIHDVGFLDSVLIGSFDMMVMSDEIIGMARQFSQGIRLDEETLAVDVIDAVGPSGHFIGEEHTLSHCREMWQPDLISRDNYENWSDEGGQRFSERVNDKVRTILLDHKPVQLDDKVMQAVQAVIDKRQEQLDG